MRARGVASGPDTGHHWEEPGSVFFTASLQVLVNIGKTPPSHLFSRLSSPFSLSLLVPGPQQQDDAQEGYQQ